MTERKPPGVNFESWVDKQIREAEARGDFAALPGRGKPLPHDDGAAYDELWWVKRKLAREGVSVLSPTLALRNPPPGPPLGLRPFDVDEVARDWRERHGA
ncbi:DnaJ family domain-containing protein [Streptomyces aureocirculatus]|uniref:DnaJ family domain-containing protein n=1 Tax=Streptomyces aureocirculatus TaxID=67275 RepID=UPI0004C77C9B|nr:DUF1992 domain-containing protein [Streptomyces aureocirculatus]